jgi:hypothetical protein
MTDITVTLEDSIITISPIIETVIQAIPAGLKGDKGDNSSSLTTSVPVGVTLNSQTVVAVNNAGLTVADNQTLAHIGKVLGISTNSAIGGGQISIVTSGGVVNGFLGLSVGDTYYLSVNGAITNIVPNTGFVQQVGTAISTTELAVNLVSPIQTI